MLWTVGHGRASLAQLAAVLDGPAIGALVDVRRHPASRRHPQFNRARFERWLAEAGVTYRWEPGLGGRREPAPTSPHTGITDPTLRAYADHMATTEFRVALDAVVAGAAIVPTAVMCAEEDWRHCHRRFIADAVTLAGRATVRHLRHDGRVDAHAVRATARWTGTTVVYDRGQLPLHG